MIDCEKRVIKYFILFTLFGFSISFLLPFKVNIGNFVLSGLLNLFFLFLVITTSIVVSNAFCRKQGSLGQKTNIHSSLQKKKISASVIYTCVLAPILGLGCLIYDRVYIRGIDYEGSLREARYAWLNSKDLGGGFFSVSGNVMITFAYLGLFILGLNLKYLSKTQRKVLALSSAISIFGVSFLNGGRSTLLIALIVFFIGRLLSLDKKPILSILNFKVLLFFVGFIIFIVSIIYSSVSLGGSNIKLSLEGIASHLGASPTSFFYQSKLWDLAYYLIYMLVYLFHGQWSQAALFSMKSTSYYGSYTFYGICLFFQKIGMFSGYQFNPGYFGNKGIFLALPGALYYDFGSFGFVISSMIFGILLGIVFIFIRLPHKLNALRYGFIVYVLFFLFLSPVIPADGFSYLQLIMFPFVFFYFFRKRLG